MELTLAELNDFQEVAAQWRESADRMGGGVTGLPDREAMTARIQRKIAVGWSLHFATENGCVIGFLATTLAQDNLDQLFVVPTSQGRAIGKALLNLAKQKMREGFALRSSSTNVRTHLFYERNGLIVLLEHFRAKWTPVRVNKMRQNKELELLSDSAETESALDGRHPRTGGWAFVISVGCLLTT